MLQLTAGRKGSVKSRDGAYKLQVWGLPATNLPAWDDSLTWTNAPGNDPASAGGMQTNEASLLATFDLPANPETGDRMHIAS